MEGSRGSGLGGEEVPHQDGRPESPSCEVAIGRGRRSLYVPSIVLTEVLSAGRQIIVEPIDSARPGGGARRLVGFRQAQQGNYFVIVVARRALHHQLPAAAYDLLVPLEDFRPLEDFVQSLK